MHGGGKGKLHDCNICGKMFTEAGAVKSHIRAIHEGLRVQCDVCAKTFSQAGSLKLHVRTVHQGGKDHSCHICGKSFSQSSSLKIHVKTLHEGHLTFVGKSLVSLVTLRGTTNLCITNLRNHIKMSIHQGQKYHQCHIYGKPFMTLEILRDHIGDDIKIVHSSRTVSNCDKTFCRVDHIKYHIKNFHAGGITTM